MAKDQSYEEPGEGFFNDTGTWKIAGVLAVVVSVVWWMFN